MTFSRFPDYGFGLICLLSASVLALNSCSENTQQVDANVKREKSAVPGLRTDVDPIRKRFQWADGIEGATWIGGRLGKDSALSVPGPSSLFLKGYATISEESWHNLVIDHHLENASQVDIPTLIDGVQRKPMRDKWVPISHLTIAGMSSVPAGWSGEVWVSLDSPRFAFSIAKLN